MKKHLEIIYAQNVNLNDEFYVYHIDKLEHLGNLSRGYIGITYSPEDRAYKHYKESGYNNRKNPKLYNFMNKHEAKIAMLVYMSGSKEKCIEEEIAQRPKKNVGLNIAPGGSENSIHLTKYQENRIVSLYKSIKSKEKVGSICDVSKSVVNRVLNQNNIPTLGESDSRKSLNENEFIEAKELLKFETAEVVCSHFSMSRNVFSREFKVHSGLSVSAFKKKNGYTNIGRLKASLVKQLYLIKKKSKTQIYKETKISPQTIDRVIHILGIEPISHSTRLQLPENKEKFFKMCNKLLTIRQVAQHYSVSESVVSRWVKESKYVFPKRQKLLSAKAKKIIEKHLKWSLLDLKDEIFQQTGETYSVSFISSYLKSKGIVRPSGRYCKYSDSELIKLMYKGMSNSEISKKIGVAEATLKHIRNKNSVPSHKEIKMRLGISNSGSALYITPYGEFCGYKAFELYAAKNEIRISRSSFFRLLKSEPEQWYKLEV